MVDFAKPGFTGFLLGQIVTTPGALRLIEAAGQSPIEFLRRHIQGNWGDLCAEDKQCNEDALVDGSRILSAYVTKNGQKLWIITEAADIPRQRAVTTILLPSEY